MPTWCRRSIICTVESAGLENAIRDSVSLGGDADTLTYITSSIAEALTGNWLRLMHALGQGKTNTANSFFATLEAAVQHRLGDVAFAEPD